MAILVAKFVPPESHQLFEFELYEGEKSIEDEIDQQADDIMDGMEIDGSIKQNNQHPDLEEIKTESSEEEDLLEEAYENHESKDILRQ